MDNSFLADDFQWEAYEEHMRILALKLQREQHILNNSTITGQHVKLKKHSNSRFKTQQSKNPIFLYSLIVF